MAHQFQIYGETNEVDGFLPQKGGSVHTLQTHDYVYYKTGFCIIMFLLRSSHTHGLSQICQFLLRDVTPLLLQNSLVLEHVWTHGTGGRSAVLLSSYFTDTAVYAPFKVLLQQVYSRFTQVIRDMFIVLS